jgi:hypothetical protein
MAAAVTKSAAPALPVRADAAGGYLRLALRLDEPRARRWHVALLARLAALPGVVVTIDAAAPVNPQAQHPGGPAGEDVARNARRLLRLETVLRRLPQAAAAPARQAEFDPWRSQSAGPADLTLDLCGDIPVGAGLAAGGGRVWRLLFNGQPGDDALLRLALNGCTPLATLVELDPGAGPARLVASARLGTERNRGLLSAFEDFLARTITLIEAACAGHASLAPALPPEPTPPRPAGPDIDSTFGMARFVAQQAGRMAAYQIYRLCFAAPHWRVGWRRPAGADLFGLRDHPEEGWAVLPDDGHRFYADPFPIEHDGRLTLFVEEFPHRTQRGVISAVEFGPDGPLGRPEPVLDLPHHLSYPFVFARDGEVWMIPESCAAGTVDLYRSTAFPGGWVKQATLLSGIVASDATLLEHAGRWWMFATVRDGDGSFSDTLHLWSAPDFRGPWSAHRANPVLIDIASARPAGRVVCHDGALLRPVQDCRRGYGAALGIARILRLDDEAFEQSVETILTAGPRWPGRRLHTLNAAGGFEFIDGSARTRRRF